MKYFAELSEEFLENLRIEYREKQYEDKPYFLCLGFDEENNSYIGKFLSFEHDLEYFKDEGYIYDVILTGDVIEEIFDNQAPKKVYELKRMIELESRMKKFFKSSKELAETQVYIKSLSFSEWLEDQASFSGEVSTVDVCKKMFIDQFGRCLDKYADGYCKETVQMIKRDSLKRLRALLS